VLLKGAASAAPEASKSVKMAAIMIVDGYAKKVGFSRKDRVVVE